MKDPTELRVQNQFGGFCTRVLKNEAARIHNEYAKRRDREKSLGELTLGELSQIAMADNDTPLQPQSERSKRRKQWVGLRQTAGGVKFPWSCA